MGKNWKHHRASERIEKRLDEVADPTIVDYTRDRSLENIPSNKAYRTDGATGLVSKRRGAAVLGAGWMEYIIMQLPYSHCNLLGIGTRERVRDCDLRSCRCLISTR